ncbi:outer membrane lipoprotein carrier protein LolA [Gammaproteobacteria bacterium 54_18_T64]|nr:outer membrane lipoprotein carrier protein LolA [Gammaproteobacteria bacterium 54_18_T64]
MSGLASLQVRRLAYSLWLALSCLLSPPVFAGESAAAQLKALLQPLSTLHADFSQRIFSADGYEIQSSRGEMDVARPGKLRWIIAPPMEQWLISDGSTLWLYDPDLEQVIIRPFQQSIADTPAMLFGGGADQLEENYSVSVSSSGTSNSYLLKPLVSTGLYQQITLVFADQTPTQIIIVDSLAQRTEIMLSNAQCNRVLSSEQIDALFSFIPPPGVDILQDD